MVIYRWAKLKIKNSKKKGKRKYLQIKDLEELSLLAKFIKIVKLKELEG